MPAQKLEKWCFLRRKLRKVYMAYFEYASLVWDPYYRKDISNLERMQGLAGPFNNGDYRHSVSVTQCFKCQT